jgi:protease IV
MSARKIAGISLLVVAVLAVVVVAVAGPTDRRAPREQVSLIELNGQILDAPQAFLAGVITPTMVRQRLEEAANNPRVGAVVLRVNSPGGAVAASQEIAETIAAHPTPVVLSMGDSSVSGGYYIATGADAIVAHPGSQTGSIGVIFSLLDYSELLDDLGVEFDVITSGEHKDMFVPGRLDDERRGMVQEMSDQYYEQFVEAVAEGRDMDVDEVRELATGEIFTGEQAYELGLVDELGGLSTAVEVAADLADLEDPQLVERRPGFFEQLGAPGGCRATPRGPPPGPPAPPPAPPAARPAASGPDGRAPARPGTRPPRGGPRTPRR